MAEHGVHAHRDRGRAGDGLGQRAVRRNVDVGRPEEVGRGALLDGARGRVRLLEGAVHGERLVRCVDVVRLHHVLLMGLDVEAHALGELHRLGVDLAGEELIPARLAALRAEGGREIDVVIDGVNDEVVAARALLGLELDHVGVLFVRAADEGAHHQLFARLHREGAGVVVGDRGLGRAATGAAGAGGGLFAAAAPGDREREREGGEGGKEEAERGVSHGPPFLGPFARRALSGRAKTLTGLARGRSAGAVTRRARGCPWRSGRASRARRCRGRRRAGEPDGRAAE